MSRPEEAGDVDQGVPSRSQRVLFLTSYFPRPGNPLIGPWALLQAQALARQDIELRVVSFTSWVPRLLARTRGARTYAECPPSHQWGNVTAEYPRWLYYPVGSRWRALAHQNPGPQMKLAWMSARGYLSKVVADWKPDVVFAHHSFPNGFLAYQLHQKFGIPYVITDHSYDDITDCWKFPKRLAQFKKVAEASARMIAVSTRMESDVRSIVPAAKAMTIHNGIDPAQLNNQSPPRPENLRDRLVLFSCGAFYQRKGFPLLIRVFSRVKAQIPNAVLRIAGDGIERPLVEKEIADHGLQDSIELLGFRPAAEVFAEMAWSDLFVLLGWDEPFATVFLEAMASGTPVVTASDGGICDVVQDRVHGRIVPPRDEAAATTAIVELLRDIPSLRAMGDNAKQLITSRLTWDVNAPRMCELFRSVAGEIKR